MDKPSDEEMLCLQVMKIEIQVVVYVRSHKGWVTGYFEGTLMSPCMYREGELIELPQISNPDDLDNCVRVVRVCHEYSSPHTEKNVTLPRAHCIFECDLRPKQESDPEILEDELEHWVKVVLPDLGKELAHFHKEGFEKIETDPRVCLRTKPSPELY